MLIFLIECALKKVTLHSKSKSMKKVGGQRVKRFSESAHIIRYVAFAWNICQPNAPISIRVII